MLVRRDASLSSMSASVAATTIVFASAEPRHAMTSLSASQPSLLLPAPSPSDLHLSLSLMARHARVGEAR